VIKNARLNGGRFRFPRKVENSKSLLQVSFCGPNATIVLMADARKGVKAAMDARGRGEDTRSYVRMVLVLVIHRDDGGIWHPCPRGQCNTEDDTPANEKSEKFSGLRVLSNMADLLIPDFSVKPYANYCGDALSVVTRLQTPVDCVVTSPPYFNQRKYGEDNKELGQEKLVQEFIVALVHVLKSINMNPWGNLWINIGNKRGKDGALMGVPSRFVVAMQDAGFFLMDDVIWAKEVVRVDGTFEGHCMIEPAKGRLNGNGWEPFYRFVLDPNKAWSDTCAVRIPRDTKHFFQKDTDVPVDQPPYRVKELLECTTSIVGRNTTNVWYVGTSRKGKNHFAAYPEELVERPIAMTCPDSVTAEGPRRRITEDMVYSEGPGKSKRIFGQYSLAESKADETQMSPEEREKLESLRKKSGRMDTARHYIPKYPQTTGWTLADLDASPGIVLDPFGGTGTTGAVALKLGRRFIGIDLYQDCVDRMDKRCQEAFETYLQHTKQDITVTSDGVTTAIIPLGAANNS